MVKEKALKTVCSILRIIIVSGVIIGCILGIGAKMGLLRKNVSRLPTVEASIEKLKEVTGAHEVDIKVLQTETSTIKEDIREIKDDQKTFFTEQRMVNTKILLKLGE